MSGINAPETLERIRAVLRLCGHRGRGVKNCLDQNLDMLIAFAKCNRQNDISKSITFANSLCVFFRKIVCFENSLTEEYDKAEYYIYQLLSITGLKYEHVQKLQDGNRELYLFVNSNVHKFEKILYVTSWIIDNDIFFESMKYALGYCCSENNSRLYQWDNYDYSNFYMFKPPRVQQVYQSDPADTL
jgi:hypothetical protein